MNRNARTWIRALRSGKYKQGEDKLHFVDKKAKWKGKERFCCLGVACVLYNKAMKRAGGKQLTVEKVGDAYSYDGNTTTLPPKVQKWLGMLNGEGSFGDEGSLIQLNDNGTSFRTIAKTIESEPPGLFKKPRKAK